MKFWEQWLWMGSVLLPFYVAVDLPLWLELLVGIGISIVLRASWIRVAKVGLADP